MQRVQFAVLAIGIAAFVLLALERNRVQQASVPSTYSTYDTGPNGYRALYGVLLAAGAPVHRFQRSLGLLGNDVRTLVISNYANDPSARGLGVHDAAALKRFVSGGGRLVALDDDFEGSSDVAPAVGSSMPVHAYGALALSRNRYTAGVERIGARVDAVFPFAMRRGIPLLANGRGIVAAVYPYGKGEVVAITAPALFGNASLRNADNLAFAYNAVAGNGAVAFDEYVHGFDDDLSFWQVMPVPVRTAFWIVGGIVVLALIGANVPFAPPVALPAATDRDSSAYVDAMASLMRRAHATRALIVHFADDASRRGRGRDAPGLRRAVADLEALREARPSEAVLLRAASIAYGLRKEYG
jgi:hypothetical protein